MAANFGHIDVIVVIAKKVDILCLWMVQSKRSDDFYGVLGRNR